MSLRSPPPLGGSLANLAPGVCHRPLGPTGQLPACSTPGKSLGLPGRACFLPCEPWTGCGPRNAPNQRRDNLYPDMTRHPARPPSQGQPAPDRPSLCLPTPFKMPPGVRHQRNFRRGVHCPQSTPSGCISRPINAPGGDQETPRRPSIVSLERASGRPTRRRHVAQPSPAQLQAAVGCLPAAAPARTGVR